MHSHKSTHEIENQIRSNLHTHKEHTQLSGKKRESLCGIKIRTPKKGQQSVKKMETVTVKELQIAPVNKIYNERRPMKRIEHLNHSTYLPRPQLQQETDSKMVTSEELGGRPQSTNSQKWKKGVEKSCLANVGGNQLRPGSSKSSRLFKKKSCLVQDYIKSQNDQAQEPRIKVNNREKEFKATLRQRIGTSISRKIGMERIQSKLDPQFFNLFAA